MQLKIAPSILSADFLNLGRDIEMLNENADLIHLDVMDGDFVPNISFGFSVIDALKGKAAVPMDAHLMVNKPHRWFETLARDGVSMVSFHYEAERCNTARCIGKIHSLGMKAGVAIDPDVKVSKLFPYIGKADFFVIMSVFAGFGGQKFIYESLDRVRILKDKIAEKGCGTLIEVDGGVTLENAGALKESGADILVAGSTVFRSENPAETIKKLAK